jgi:uncharacterized RDD family membrane protein YckC
MNEPPVKGLPAGFVSRALAFCLDVAIIAVTLFLVATMAQWLLGFFRLGAPLSRSSSAIVPIFQTAREVISIGTDVVFALFILAYPIVWWVLIGQTPGKMLFGLRVVRSDGQRLTIWRALLRCFAYWLSALPLGLGFFWVLFDRRRQGWHDKLADTSVVYAPQTHRPLAPRALPA